MPHPAPASRAARSAREASAVYFGRLRSPSLPQPNPKLSACACVCRQPTCCLLSASSRAYSRPSAREPQPTVGFTQVCLQMMDLQDAFRWWACLVWGVCTTRVPSRNKKPAPSGWAAACERRVLHSVYTVRRPGALPKLSDQSCPALSRARWRGAAAARRCARQGCRRAVAVGPIAHFAWACILPDNLINWACVSPGCRAQGVQQPRCGQ